MLQNQTFNILKSQVPICKILNSSFLSLSIIKNFTSTYLIFTSVSNSYRMHFIELVLNNKKNLSSNWHLNVRKFCIFLRGKIKWSYCKKILKFLILFNPGPHTAQVNMSWMKKLRAFYHVQYMSGIITRRLSCVSDKRQL
jgi:hypothetical protein